MRDWALLTTGWVGASFYCGFEGIPIKMLSAIAVLAIFAIIVFKWDPHD